MLYLNGGFDGGRFAFVDADADRVVEPRAGRLLCFTSGAENLHGVERVDKPKTAPVGLNMRPGRLNLTFRAVR